MLGSEYPCTLANTKLTEIKLALDLSWHDSISSDKINLGLGFYGRSFQLIGPGCYQPGCPGPFKGGANPEPYTANSSTISYREIIDIIAVNALKKKTRSSMSPEADQWVSYDDQDVFQAKIKFADDQGLDGLLIWSLDEDTSQLDALSGVMYPRTLGSIRANAKGADNRETSGTVDCRVTSCGTTRCNTGEVHMTDRRCDGDGNESSSLSPRLV